ncbi:MAG TPA: histidine kinase [Solirubrobacteraceae bacterium]|jgi:signal transduction histidine kinase|nr:histidine kinase [Solirubrobacteraceae bacterium]
MLIGTASGRLASSIRLAGLAAVTWSILNSHVAPATSGRGLVVLVAFVPAFVSWLVWTFWSTKQSAVTPDLYVMAICGGLLQAATPSSAASVFTFVVAMSAAARAGVLYGLVMAALGAAAVGAGAIIYDQQALPVLAYALGFAATTLGGTNIRQSRLRLEQTELLLAQTQRSHEEQLRAARLEESTRIARDIHDVLAHTLAGLVIQLEATDVLLEQDSDRAQIRERVQQAHELAREGLQEARRAVGALRGNGPAAAPAHTAIRALVEQYEHPIELRVSGDEGRLQGQLGEAVLRVIQEALTNIRKHAPGAAVTVELTIAERQLDVVVENRALLPVSRPSLADAGGGYGLRGMRERATALGGTLTAGPTEDGWRVGLCLPLDQAPSAP